MQTLYKIFSVFESLHSGGSPHPTSTADRAGSNDIVSNTYTGLDAVA